MEQAIRFPNIIPFRQRKHPIQGPTPIVIQAFTGFKQWMTADDILAGKAFPGRKIVIIFSNLLDIY